MTTVIDADLVELSRPFPEDFVERKDGQDYVAHHVVNQRLLSIVGPFDFELVQVIRGDVAAVPPDPPPAAGAARPARPPSTTSWSAASGASPARSTTVRSGSRRSATSATSTLAPRRRPPQGRRLRRPQALRHAPRPRPPPLGARALLPRPAAQGPAPSGVALTDLASAEKLAAVSSLTRRMPRNRLGRRPAPRSPHLRGAGPPQLLAHLSKPVRRVTPPLVLQPGATRSGCGASVRSRSATGTAEITASLLYECRRGSHPSSGASPTASPPVEDHKQVDVGLRVHPWRPATPPSISP